MPKDEVDFDALGLSDEALGIAGEEEGGGTSAGGRPRKGAGEPGRRRRGRGRILLFLVGLGLGIAGTLLLPRWLDPYLPTALRSGAGEAVEGEVLGKRLEGDRLLLTVETSRGAVLATFGERVAEIDLLVEPGDSVTLGLGRYRPFVEDPSVEGVRKARAGGERGTGPGASPEAGRSLVPPPGEAEAVDSAAAGTDTTDGSGASASSKPAEGPRSSRGASDEGAR